MFVFLFLFLFLFVCAVFVFAQEVKNFKYTGRVEGEGPKHFSVSVSGSDYAKSCHVRGTRTCHSSRQGNGNRKCSSPSDNLLQFPEIEMSTRRSGVVLGCWCALLCGRGVLSSVCASANKNK